LPGFTPFAEACRNKLLANSIIRDAGDIPADHQFKVHIPCPILHPGLCVTRDVDRWREVSTFRSRAFALLQPSKYYKLVGSAGLAECYIRVTYKRANDPRILVAIICSRRDGDDIANFALALNFTSALGSKRFDFKTDSELAGMIVGPGCIVDAIPLSTCMACTKEPHVVNARLSVDDPIHHLVGPMAKDAPKPRHGQGAAVDPMESMMQSTFNAAQRVNDLVLSLIPRLAKRNYDYNDSDEGDGDYIEGDNEGLPLEVDTPSLPEPLQDPSAANRHGAAASSSSAAVAPPPEAPPNPQDVAAEIPPAPPAPPALVVARHPVARGARQAVGENWGTFLVSPIYRNTAGERRLVAVGLTCKRHKNDTDVAHICKVYFPLANLSLDVGTRMVKHWALAGATINTDDPLARSRHLQIKPRQLSLLSDAELDRQRLLVFGA
jgi:hypothetical protein